MPKKVKNGDELPVSVVVEFTGYVTNYIITVERKVIALTNLKADNVKIKFDGDPVLITGRFTGDSDAKINKFEVTINGYTAEYNNTKIKSGDIEIKDARPYSFFDLTEED